MTRRSRVYWTVIRALERDGPLPGTVLSFKKGKAAAMDEDEVKHQILQAVIPACK